MGAGRALLSCSSSRRSEEGEWPDLEITAGFYSWKLCPTYQARSHMFRINRLFYILSDDILKSKAPQVIFVVFVVVAAVLID